MVVIAVLIGILITGFILTLVALGPAGPVPWLFVAAIVVIILIVKFREKTRFVTWKPEYSVGVDVLDKDHQKLIELINQFQSAVHYNTGEHFEREILDELVDYTKTHFKREEEMLEGNGYEYIEAHKTEHEEMIKKVEFFVQNYAQKGHKAFPETAEFLSSWLVDHICGTDQRYTSFLNEKGVH